MESVDPHEFIRRFLLHVLPKGSTASAESRSNTLKSKSLL